MESPYKGLVPYEVEDAAYFFGRDSEIATITANLCASRLTLLYGESGVGKSSLLNAGVAHKLRNDPDYYNVVFRTWKGDPVAGLCTAIAGAIPDAKDLHEAPDLAATIRTWLDRHGPDERRTILVILDQFEEFFQYHPLLPAKDGKQSSGLFDKQLASLLASDLPLNVLLSIREDSLAGLDRFKGILPNLFDNYLRVDYMAVEGARDAILKPLDRSKQDYPDQAIAMMEPRERLANLVIDEIIKAQSDGGQRVQTPTLQLVVSQWWQAEYDSGSRVMREQTFLALGGVRDIVAKHLSKTLDKLSEEDPEVRQIAAALFDNRLVTTTGRKMSRTLSELVTGTGFDKKHVSDLIERLIAARVLTVVGGRRGEEGSHHRFFEFTHDLMAEAAAQWFERYEQTVLRPAELRVLLTALHSSSAAVPHVEELDHILESILLEVTDDLCFQFATISLVDEYRNCIETVRGKNVSPGWIMRAKHPLDVPDIQTHIVRTATAKKIIGWDDLLDKGIYERFEHWRLARVWVPIISSDNLVIGTIEAGCYKERADEILTDSMIDCVKMIGRKYGDAIATKRPHILLRGIAQDAIQLIGADSASLHVYRQHTADTQELDWGELILAAGAGKADANFVQDYQPRARGRARLAIESNKTQWVDDPQHFATEYPELFARGVRALAVVPLKLGHRTSGVLGINFWHDDKQITPRELNLAEVFARAMEGVIRNYLMLRYATEARSRAWGLSGLRSLMQSLNSPFSLPDVLKKVAVNALLTLDADCVTVYQYHTDTRLIYLPPVAAGQFNAPLTGDRSDESEDVLLQLIDHGKSQFHSNVWEYPLFSASQHNLSPRFIDRENIKSCAVLVLRCSDREEVVGLLFVNYRQAHTFTVEEKGVMEVLATSAALAIRNTRLHKLDLTRQLDAMHSVHAAIAEKGPDLKQVIQRLLQQTLRLTGATFGVCMQWNPRDELLELLATWPDESCAIDPLPLGQGIVGLAAQTRRSILVEDVKDTSKTLFVETVGDIIPAAQYKKVKPETRCEIAVPMLDHDQLLGVLNIEHPQPAAFTQEDRVLLQTLAVPAINAFRTVDLYKRLERRIRHLRALNVIASRVQRKLYDANTILRLFLTGITAGGGIGFSRAMLFLADREGKKLHGESAIGPIAQEQAQQVWDTFEPAPHSSGDELDDLLMKAERFGEVAQNGVPCEYSPLTSAIRQVSFAVDASNGAPANSVISGKTISVGYNQEDPFRKILQHLTKPEDILQPFVAVPLGGKHTRHIGVIVVDNRFLWKEREIDAEDVAGLEAFAGLLAMSIENASLQKGLTAEQKVANWREVTGGIVKSVGSILFDLKDNVNRLGSHLSEFHEQAWLDVESLFDSLSNGITAAEKAIWEVRGFANPSSLECQEIDLGALLIDVFQSEVGDSQVIMSLPERSVSIFADPLKLRAALQELRKNAQEAMFNGPRVPTLNIKLSAHNSASVHTYTEIEIMDNGAGFTPEVKRRLFEPFFTTKTRGTGLGLATAHNIIAAHDGTLEADNNPAGGARFIIRIPTKAL